MFLGFQIVSMEGGFVRETLSREEAVLNSDASVLRWSHHEVDIQVYNIPIQILESSGPTEKKLA